MTQDTIFACDELAELQQHNALLKVQNKELMARCDLLEEELAGLKDAVATLRNAERALLRGSGHRDLESVDAARAEVARLLGEE